MAAAAEAPARTAGGERLCPPRTGSGRCVVLPVLAAVAFLMASAVARPRSRGVLAVAGLLLSAAAVATSRLRPAPHGAP
jgi:hypothetical protein